MLFVPYDDAAHRDQFLQLNVEYLTWFINKASTQHNIDLPSVTDSTIREYVERIIDDYTCIPSSEGIIYMLEIEGRIVGMGVLKKLEADIGEIKRMYIRPEYRGRRYGKTMLSKLIDKGKALGYSPI